jgi:tetratricopeptide (TPR) repeat protein
LGTTHWRWLAQLPGSRVSHLPAIGINYEYKSEYDSAARYINLSLNVQKDLGDKKGQAKCLGNLANINFQLGRYFTSLEYYKRALLLNKTGNNPDVLAQCYSNMAATYQELGDYMHAVDYLYEALRVYKQQQNQEGIAVCNLNLGVIYTLMNNDVKARGCFNQARDIFNQLQMFTVQATVFIDLGQLCQNGHMQDSAVYYYNMARKIYQNAGDKIKAASVNQYISGMMQEAGDYSGAIACIRSVIDVFRGIGNSAELTQHYNRLANIYLKIAEVKPAGFSAPGALASALVTIDSSIYYSVNAGTIADLMDAYQISAKACSLKGDFKAAYIAAAQYHNLKDSLHSVEVQTKIADHENKLALEGKENELQINKLRLLQQRNKLIIFIVSTVLLVLVITITGRYLRTQLLRNRLLRNEKKRHLRQIENQSETLSNIAHIQAHEIRGPVATILGLAQILDIEDAANPANKEIIAGIAEVAERLDAIVTDVVNKTNIENKTH